MGREVEGRFKREGTYVYLRLVYVDVRQPLTQYCQAIILQLKKKGNCVNKGWVSHAEGCGKVQKWSDC